MIRALIGMVVLCGCVGPRGAREARTWLLYVREVPVAHVVVDGASTGNVVDVSIQGDTAAVTLHHGQGQGQGGKASLLPVPGARPPGLRLAFKEDLGGRLGRLLSERQYDDIQRALDGVPATSRDDLSLELVRPALDEALRQATGDERGRRLLDRLVDEVTSGHEGEDEREAALWLIALKAQRIPPEAYARAALDAKTKVVPIRKQGVTVLKDAPLTARRRQDGGVDVRFPERVFGFDEARTLPSNAFRLAEDEVVCAVLYDEGGRRFCAPAIFLVQLSNEADVQVLYKGLEMGAWGLTVGAGALAGAGVRAATWARVVVWCDRTAALLGALTSLVAEHRGWILEKYGERGARFLRYVDGVNSAVAIYGLARVATAIPKFLAGLHAEYQQLRAARVALGADERAALEAIGERTGRLLREVEELNTNPETGGGNVIPLERARAARKPATASPAVEEAPLRATGTEGRLVPLGEGQTAREPQRPPSPERAGPQSDSGGTAGRAAPATVALSERELAVASALVKKGVPAAQAEGTARLASELGVMEDVETLARSPGYRNPRSLRKFLIEFRKGSRGHAQALDDAARRARLGHEVVLDGAGADVVDYSVEIKGVRGEAIQHKHVWSSRQDTATNSLREAARQLRGDLPEKPPPGFTRTIDLRFDASSASPLQSADRAALEVWLRELANGVYNQSLRGVERIKIMNSKGTFIFDAPFTAE